MTDHPDRPLSISVATGEAVLGRVMHGSRWTMVVTFRVTLVGQIEDIDDLGKSLMAENTT